MESMNYDIVAIQNQPDKMEEVLDQIQGSEYNVLVTNSQTTVRLGRRSLKRTFDTILYCEDKGIIVLLMRYGKPTKKEFISALDQRNIPYHEVSFLKYQENREDELEEKEFCFASDQEDLIKAIKESRAKGNDICSYYPKLLGKINMRQNLDTGERELFDSRPIKGVLDFPDKLICLMTNGRNPDFYTKPVLNLLEELEVCPIMEWSCEYPEREKGIEYQKELDY